MSYVLSPKWLLPLALIAFGGVATPASADGQLSVYAGPQFFAQDSSLDYLLTDIELGYDFGPKESSQQIRLRADLGDAFASGSYATSGANIFHVGGSARLTTPTYFGAGISFESVSVPQQFGPIPGILPGGVIDSNVQTSVTGLGAKFFVGQTLYSHRGLGLAIEGSYSFVPRCRPEPERTRRRVTREFLVNRSQFVV